MTNSPVAVTPAEIVAFWRDAGPEKWFKKDENFDAELRARFLAAHEAAAKGQFDGWEATAEGALALLLLLDQVSRNMFRNDAHAFAADEKARGIAARALTRGFDAAIPGMRSFFFLPFEHSEDMADQELAMRLFKAAGDEDGLKWAALHADIIRRFGRFPHRNKVLGRESTPEEVEAMAGPMGHF
jgi:uncharacterized protein (DUF924 family)